MHSIVVAAAAAVCVSIRNIFVKASLEGLQLSLRAMPVQLGPQDLGRIDIQYRRVPCMPPIDMIVDVDGNHGPGYWLRLNVQVSTISNC